jgi:hypothetical protein
MKGRDFEVFPKDCWRKTAINSLMRFGRGSVGWRYS